MRIAVMNVGIVGISSAHELNAAKYGVVESERKDRVAGGTGSANAGVIARHCLTPHTAYRIPHTAPGMASTVMLQLLGQHSLLRPNINR